jgi:arylsulfatase A-like enzyme
MAQVVRRDRLDRDDPATAAIAKGAMEGRSGDLFMVPRRDWIIEQRADGDATTHGTMYEYDRRVPLLIAGAGLPPGPTSETASPLDIAPTLAAAAGLRLPDRDGRSLLRRPRGVSSASAGQPPADWAAATSGPRGTPR